MKRKMYRWLSSVMLIVLLFAEAGNLPVVWAAGDEDGGTEDVVSENGDNLPEPKEVSEDPLDDEGSQEPEAVQPGEVTRLEWWRMLIETFGMTVETDNYPDNYFCDLNSSFEYYRDIMVATEFGLVDVEAGDAINVDEAATREFAAHSLNVCLGFQRDEDTGYTFSEADSVEYPNDIQIAIDKGWFTLNDGSFEPDKPITSAEMTTLKEYAQNVLKEREIDPEKENSWVFADGVVDITKSTNAFMSDVDEFTLSDCQAALETGKIYGFLVDGDPVVRRFVEINATENEKEYVVKTESVSSEEAYESISISNEGQKLNLKNAVLCDPDMELQYVVGGTLEENFEDGVVYDTVSELNNRDVSAIIVTREYDIPTRVMKDHEIDLGGGKKAVLSFTIGDPFIDKDIDCMKILSYNQKAYIQVSIPVTFSCNVSLDVLSDIGVSPKMDLAYLPLAGGIGYIKTTLEMTLKGSVLISYVQMLTVGVSYSAREGFSVYKNFYKEKFTIEAKAEASIGIKASIGFDLGVLKGEAYGKFGGEAVAETKFYDDGKNPVNCAQVYAWLYLKYGYKATFDYWLDKKSWGDEVNILTRKNSPVKVCLHFEDGVKVARCTRENAKNGEINGNTTNGIYKYYTPINSRYAVGGGNTGYDESGKEYTLFETSKDEDSKTCTVTKYNGNVSALSIPSEIDGYKVIGIAANVFKGRSELVFVSMPDTVTKIDNYAFSDCSNLEVVKLSKGLTTLGYSAFNNDDKIESIEIPKSLATTTTDVGFYEARKGPFNSCDGLKTITFEEGTTRIPNFLFAHCPGIETITIPDTVTLINDNAFLDCRNLRNVIIPDSVETINGWAFSGCISLASIALSENLSYLGEGAFSGDVSLASAFIPKSLKTTKEHYCGGYSVQLGPYATAEGPLNNSGPFSGCDNLREVLFEEGTTKIPAYLFAHCNGIEEIEIPGTVTEIGAQAFDQCQSLKKITFNSGLNGICAAAFANLTSLTELNLPASLVWTEPWAFAGCSKITEVQLPEKLKTIGGGAFCYCSNLEKVTVDKVLNYVYCGDGILDSQKGAFLNCENLKEIVIEDGMKEIPEYLFSKCSGLENISIPDSVVKINANAFEECTKLQEITIPAKCTYVGNSAFKNCKSVKEIVFPNSITGMGTYVMEGCSSLERAVLNDTRVNITAGTFLDCTALKEVVIPDTVEAIREDAFRRCYALEKIVIPPRVTIIEASAFRGCEKLKEVVFNDKLSTIGDYAFQADPLLEEISLPNSVASIGRNCFAVCDSLKEIKLSTGITAIPQYAFYQDPALESIVLPYYVKSIGAYAFADSVAFKEITIPRNVSSIATNAFSYKDKLTIYGITGTYAETFANDNGIKFVNREVNATEVKFTEDMYTIYTNSTLRLPYSVTPEDYTDEMTWAISKGSDKVSLTDGVVKGLKVTDKDDPAVIKLTVGDKLASCKVVVLQSVTSLYLNKSSLTMNSGDTEQLTCSVYPDSASDKTVSWSSSDSNIASVDENGKVTAVAAGTCTITVTANDGGGAKNSCAITVKGAAHHPQNAEEMQSSHPYEKNCSDIWIYKSEGAGNICITFSEETKLEEDTEGDYILIKDKDGNLIGKYYGTDLAGKTVTVPGDTFWLQLVSDAIDSKDYGFSVTKIDENVNLVGITGLSVTPETITLREGESGVVTASITPANATDKSVAWSSSDTSVATVSGTGLSAVINAVKAGTTSITAKAGGFTATVSIIVVDENEPIAEVESISISPKEITMVTGISKQFKAAITPDDIADAAISWSSSNASIASVTGNGLEAEVSALSPGTAVITATAGSVSAKATVTVIDAEDDPDHIYVSGITLSHAKVNMMEGKTLSLEAEVSPYNASDSELRWESDNESVATVDWDWDTTEKATVTARSEGTATITAYATDGSGVSASCTVTVRKEGSGGPGEAEDGKVYVAAKGKADVGSVIKASLSANIASQIKKYTSSDKKIASVTGKGIVKGKKAGTVTITAYIKNGKKYEPVATIELIVTKPVFDFGTVTLTDVEEPLYLYDYVKDLPKGTPVSWSIPKSKSSIAVIDGDEVVATGKSGTVTVTCIIGSGKNVVKYKAKLKAVMPPYLPKETRVKVNKWKTITVYNVPKGKKVSWKWGAMIDENGELPFLMKSSGKKCKVKVTSPNASVTIGVEVDGKICWTKLVVE
ncbi:MAG: leucine-rich repeat protein [Lachnospiraceae bacterium]|nr:leucine-rich repeat protein [Lachnospiraceae bacterium]